MESVPPIVDGHFLSDTGRITPRWRSGAKSSVRRLGRGRTILGHPRLVDRNLQDERFDPQAWLANVLDKIANRHPMSKIDELLPWAYINNGAKRQAA